MGHLPAQHDKLTLEQVSDEERDYLMAEYAKDPRMKRHMGIGRRLAPLLDNDRRTAELLYTLILSLPGSPVIYYGDELLMGDNIYLGEQGLGAHPHAVVARPQRRVLQGRLRPAVPPAPSWTPSTARAPTWRRSCATRGRSCTGCVAC